MLVGYLGVGELVEGAAEGAVEGVAGEFGLGNCEKFGFDIHETRYYYKSELKSVTVLLDLV